MKRLFVALAALALAAGIASAQDFNAAVEAFNMGAQTLESNKAEALNQFKSALTQFEACSEEEAADMVAQCKKIIPQTILSIAKEQINEASYDEALETLKEAAAVAEGYGLEDIAAEATALVPTAYSRKGAALLKAKDFIGAAAAFKSVVTLNPEDGQSQLLYGQALMQAGDNETAIAAIKVCNRYFVYQARLRRRQHLVSIAENHRQIGFQFFQRIRKPNHRQPHRFQRAICGIG